MSDITVHIDETLDAATIHALEKDLYNKQGVQHIHSTDMRPHLMVVQYDHRELNSMQILNEFSDHGLHAELIGF